MSELRIPITVVNHVTIDITASPEALWSLIVDQYVGARKFAGGGHSIEPLEDAAAGLGGFRMRLEQDGAVVDDRLCIVTERDEVTRRLSMFADYLMAPGGLQVFATYQAHAAEGGARYSIDCHTRMTLAAPSPISQADATLRIAEMAATFEAPLNAYLASVKATLERGGA